MLPPSPNHITSHNALASLPLSSSLRAHLGSSPDRVLSRCHFILVYFWNSSDIFLKFELSFLVLKAAICRRDGEIYALSIPTERVSAVFEILLDALDPRAIPVRLVIAIDDFLEAPFVHSGSVWGIRHEEVFCASLFDFRQYVRTALGLAGFYFIGRSRVVPYVDHSHRGLIFHIAMLDGGVQRFFLQLSRTACLGLHAHAIIILFDYGLGEPRGPLRVIHLGSRLLIHI